jgi:hypothetical protein
MVLNNRNLLPRNPVGDSMGPLCSVRLPEKHGALLEHHQTLLLVSGDCASTNISPPTTTVP